MNSMKRYERRGETLKAIGTIIIFVLLLAILGEAESVYGSKPYSDRREPVASRCNSIKTLLSQLTYGINNRMPELVKSKFQVDWKNIKRNSNVRGDDEYDVIETFISRNNSAISHQYVYLVNPKIKYLDNITLVECFVVWKITDESGRTYWVKESETYTIKETNRGHAITEARTTPIIFQHWNNQKKLKDELAKVRSVLNK